MSPLGASDWHTSTELDLKVYWDKTQNFCCDLSVFQITRCTLLHSIKGCANSVRMRHHHLLKLYTTGQVLVALTPSTTSATDRSALFDRPRYHFLQKMPLLCLLGQNIPIGFQLCWGFKEEIIYVGKTFGECPSD